MLRRTNFNTFFYNKRKIFAFVNHAFNAVDGERLKIVGPDRLCAEWILKNGGAVRFKNHTDTIMNDYNALPPEYQRIILKEIDATNSSIMSLGFNHLKNCRQIDKIILNNCNHMENTALEKLNICRKSLIELHIIKCYNIKESGLLTSSNLYNLQKLVISDLNQIKNLSDILQQIQDKLKHCNIINGYKK